MVKSQPYSPDWCTDPAFLAEVAKRRCDDNKTSIFVVNPDLRHYGQIDSERRLLEMLTDDLCEAERFMRPLATAIVKIRDRVQAAVDERGGISVFEYLASYFRRDGVVRRMAVVDRGLGAFLPFVEPLGLQRQLLAGVARSMLKACRLQDALRARVDTLYADQSARWSLEWDANSSAAVVTFVTFPEIEEAMMQVESALAQMKAERERRWCHDNGLGPLELKLVLKMKDGWLRRLGLDPELPHLHRNPNWEW